jgi:hypothetical protein
VKSANPASRYATVKDLGTPDDAAKKVLDQYLNEFMSTRIGVRRESSVVSATEREAIGLDGEPTTFYDVKLRISSYATKNQYGLTEVGLALSRYFAVTIRLILMTRSRLMTASAFHVTNLTPGSEWQPCAEADRPQVIEWDRILTSALGTANGRLYELRMQCSVETFDNSEPTFKVVRDSFKPFAVDQSNLSFPLF